MQASLGDQIREDAQFAAQKRMYTPPEFVCIDIQTGRKSDRDGLNRMRDLLERKLIGVLLVFKVSRVFRAAHQGFAFVNDNVVERGLRAIGVSQGIDTNDRVTWKMLLMMHGLSDEMLVTAIADHVRSGLAGLFLQGYVTGALTLGYRGVEVPGARPTKLGRPRRMPGVDPNVAKLIVQAYESVRDGMPVHAARRQWITLGGPCDKPSRIGVMSYGAFRRMLSNPRYIGYWAFGRTRNQWSSGKDYVCKVSVPETEVKVVQSDELRIVPDELFYSVQNVLAKLKLGPRGPKRRKEPQLWDLVTDVFHCAECKKRFYQYGTRSQGMRCKMMDLCPAKAIINRQKSVTAVCQAVGELLNRDPSLVSEIIRRAEVIDGQSDEVLLSEARELERRLTTLRRKLEDLHELVGDRER